MKNIGLERVKELQKHVDRIRNICIMAHVDHGKTTLADSLVASNGIISQKLVGKLRYMDSRVDEQERGITMKSSSIALYYLKDEKDYLINLIDSPGHVDFSSEVSTAVRICDGAIILVDVLEGVCPQTKVSLKQAWLENIKPVLVFNKIDRLILERQLTPLDAYIHLTQVLEQVNAVIGELFTSDVLLKEDEQPKSATESGDMYANWSSGLDAADDSECYFSPDQGNVIFASAIDGWGFSVKKFAKLYSQKLGIDESQLQQGIWGDYYLNKKTMQIVKGAQEKAKKPLFVQFIFENIWSLYDTILIRKDTDKLLKIVESLNLEMKQRDLRQTDARAKLQIVFSQWLPLAEAVLSMVCTECPAPNELSDKKVEKLLSSSNQPFQNLPPQSQALKSEFLKCSSSDETPLVIFVSKMFPVERKCLPVNKQQPLTMEEIARRRELIAKAKLAREAGITPSTEKKEPEKTDGSETANSKLASVASDKETVVSAEKVEESEHVFVAFARVYCGCARKGAEVFVLGPKHNPALALKMAEMGHVIDDKLTLQNLSQGQHIMRAKLSDLYLLMGRELESLDEVPAGNVFGIGGLEDYIVKTGTLSTELACPAFSELNLMAVPILRVAVEPVHPAELPKLMKGLKILNQADACVQVIIQETGEHVLVTAGEVHLQRCIDDLEQRYAKIKVRASEPIVPFRETIVPPPSVDMVNEAITPSQPQPMKKEGDKDGTSELITMKTANSQSTIILKAVPLPQDVTKFLENNSELIKIIYKSTSIEKKSVSESLVTDEMNLMNLEEKDLLLDEKTASTVKSFKEKLRGMFKEAGEPWSENSVDEIWSFGPRCCGPNILVNQISSYKERSIWEKVEAHQSNPLTEYDSSFIGGFQLATLAGPLCEEPMMGVAFVVQDWTVDFSEFRPTNLAFGPLSGQIMSAVKDGCRKAFQAQPQRLMAAMYSCSILVSAEVLGKMYGVLGKRHGRVLHGDLSEGSSSFNVTAVLPVVESFSFAPEIRRQTSGLASPQLVFSHWEVIDIDPFWEPSTMEEYLHYGEKADSENRARIYMNAVRKRKGLSISEKLVEHAEKQRTLSKNK
ncbi:unnamed protein product [Bemisia tabaci]|uniref:Ribosome assembly protein 1 n=1 Tax=Bemisia tabaci TaxID=7038 RepID=A0A9P0F5P5_BEMTA|nr:unnamed protein product [Bemisia tabaci]